MPSLDIATVQPSLQTHLVPLGIQSSIIHAKTLPNPWKSSRFRNNVELYAGHLHFRRGKLLIAAVATVEHKCPVQKEDVEESKSQLLVSSSPIKDQNETVSVDSEQLDVRERLRRMRISKANKGNTPWNKGRKHSPETLKKIRERTKLAMQNPKVKMKLVNFGHAQSEETKLKIGEGVRMGWEKRRVRQMLQETCCFEWQNLIAEAARRGFIGEEELQWDSYKTLDEQLMQEWLESVEQRRNMTRAKGSKRAPKPPEQRRKIAAAVAAKWADPVSADPVYRERVLSGLAKYHRTPVGVERKPKRRPSSGTESTKRGPKKKSSSDIDSSSRGESKVQTQRQRLRKSNMPVYKDPLASSKLEMIKNIRAQRAVAESKKVEAIERARLLISEAENAAKALEVAAVKSPVAQASLIESRKLIAEAIQLIETLESGQTTSDENGIYPSEASPQQLSQLDNDIDTELENADTSKGLGQLNGTQIFPLSGRREDPGFPHLTWKDRVNGHIEILPSTYSSNGLPTSNLEGTVKHSGSAKQLSHIELKRNIEVGPNGTKVQLEPNGAKVHVMEEKDQSPKPVTVTKKWVRGRLVEVRGGG